MQLLISDANILIDMEEGQLLQAMFRLPFQFQTPNLLFADELAEQHPYLPTYGLQLGILNGESMNRVSQLTLKYKNTGRYDCMALALAQQEQCTLLTGDQNLTKAAKAEKVETRGSIWLVEQLVSHRMISIASARHSYAQMEANGRRLPWKQARQRLNELEATLLSNRPAC